MLDNSRYRLRLIQLRILRRLYRGLLTPKLSHPVAVLRCILSSILPLALGVRPKTNHLLAEHLHPISTMFLIRSTSIGVHLVPHEFYLLLLMLFVLGVRLVYRQYLLLLGLGQSHQPPAVLIVLREELRLLL